MRSRKSSTKTHVRDPKIQHLWIAAWKVLKSELGAKRAAIVERALENLCDDLGCPPFGSMTQLDMEIFASLLTGILDSERIRRRWGTEKLISRDHVLRLVRKAEPVLASGHVEEANEG